jgi:hypothetical protein
MPLVAPLPNAVWAAALVDSIADGHAHPRERGPRETAAPAAAYTTADHRGNLHTPMAARILDEQMRIIGMSGDAQAIQRRMVAVESTINNLMEVWLVGRAGELAAATAEGRAPDHCGPDHRVADPGGRRSRGSPTAPDTAMALGGRRTEAGRGSDQLAHVLKVDQRRLTH